jgi:hypothetical protein
MSEVLTVDVPQDLVDRLLAVDAAYCEGHPDAARASVGPELIPVLLAMVEAGLCVAERQYRITPPTPLDLAHTSSRAGRC